MRWSYKLQLAIARDINGRSFETFTNSVALINDFYPWRIVLMSNNVIMIIFLMNGQF
jgi:hypothetical protein